MTLQDKYNNLLSLTKTIVWYNKLKSGRGYLTADEKKKLYLAEKQLENIKELPKQLSL